MAQKFRQTHSRAQIELSMLTRFAMIFFIVSLAAMMLSLSSAEKSHLCSSQADSLSATTSSYFSQVLNSPVEDERRILPLTSTLAVGKEEFARYTITITNHEDKKYNKNFFSIEISPLTNAACYGHREVYYNSTQVIFTTTTTSNERNDEVLTLDPSTPKIDVRSSFLVIIKCKPKQFNQQPVIFIENCVSKDPDKCMDFQSERVKLCCGWPENVQELYAIPQTWQPQCA